MRNIKLYRLALKLLPKKTEKHDRGLSEAVIRVLKNNHVKGAALACFDSEGVRDTLCYGRARLADKQLVTPDTRFRTASVSKHITAMACMRLAEEGMLDLDMDVSQALGFTLRHPEATDKPITLRMLLSHTAGIHDGTAYDRALSLPMTEPPANEAAKLQNVMQGDSFTTHLPGEKWEYSNLGAGIVGCVLEGVTGKNFDSLMREAVFEPLGIKASYYPQRLGEPLADAWRVLPRSKTALYDAKERLSRPLPLDKPDVQYHYSLAHGNLCITAGELAQLGYALMLPGYLQKGTLREMRRVIAPFGTRAHNLSEGIGTFILKDESISKHVIYGHQGLAYGAVHGLFYDSQEMRGFAILTTACSEARDGVLTDMNGELISLLIG